jgi:diguanylate cyclase (GGDEF)-like protein
MKYTTLTSFSRCAAIVVAAIGIVVLAGWVLDIDALKSVVPSLVTMKANTACLLVALAVGLYLRTTPPATTPQQRIGPAFGIAVIAVACVTLAQDFLGTDFGIDQFLFSEDSPSPPAASPGRMAPMTAISFILLGLSLVLLDAATRSSQWCALLALMLATLALTGYGLGVRALYQVMSFASMAIHTAAALGLLSLGLIATRPDEGFMKIIGSDTSGGLLARLLLPLIPLLLFVIGWLCLQGELRGYYDTRFGLALMVTVNSLVMIVLVWQIARVLYNVDLQRRQAQEQAAVANAGLERAVKDRTADLEAANLKLKIEIAERERAQEAVQRLSLTDELTGLHNRRGFFLLAEQELKLARRTNSARYLFFADVDGLKHTNDAGGHKAGDALLILTATVLRMSLRDVDLVARLGGDEFVALAAADTNCDVILERLQQAVEQINREVASPYPLSLSVGAVHCLPGEETTLGELLAKADALMYAKKLAAHRDRDSKY